MNLAKLAHDVGLTDPDLGDWMTDYGFSETAIRLFAVGIAERCALEVIGANAYRGGHGDPPRLTDQELADRIRALFAPSAAGG